MNGMFFRLKELVLRERNAKTKLQVDIQHLKDEVERLHRELDQSRHKVEDQQKALQTLEETLSKVETQRAQRQALEVQPLFLTEENKYCIGIGCIGRASPYSAPVISTAGKIAAA